MRRILFVDDEQRILDGLQRMLRPRRHEWAMEFACGPAAALAALEAQTADVIVTDMRMPEMDGAELLDRIMRRWPSTVRIVLSGQTELSAAARAVRVAHQFLSKPCDASELSVTIERLCALQELLGDASMRDVVGAVDSLPSIPAVFAELERTLASTSAPLPAISAIVERDAGLSAKLLQLVNSSFFGRPRHVTRIDHAAGLLGVQVLRSLVLSHEISNSSSLRAAAAVLSLEEQHEHALLVAALARRLAPTGPATDTAFVAGILHDTGKLLLASTMPESYREVLAEATSREVPAHDVELERRGASHAEVGAYLLGLWGLPPEIVAAVAHHHRPARASEQHRELVTLVHAADALAHEVTAERRGVKSPVLLDEACLAHAGIATSLGDWRMLAREVSEAHS